MEITVVDEEENPMLHRTDVTFRVSHVEATPDRLAVRDSLAARLNKDADEVVIRKLDTKFGMRTTYGEAKVYESPVQAQEVEQAHMLERNKIADSGAEDAEADVDEPEPEVEEAPEEDDTSDAEEEDVEAEEPEAEAEDEEPDEEAEAEADDADEEASADDEDADEETEE